MSSHRLHPVALIVLLALSLGACHSWGGGRVPSPEAERFRFLNGPVRVTRADGPPIVLVGVRISRDSLFGDEHARPYGRVAIPLSNVRKVETRRVDPLETGAVVALTAAFAVTLFAFVMSHSECSCIAQP